MSTFGPVQEDYAKLLLAMAQVLDQELNGEADPPPHGFVLLLFPLNDAGSGRMNFASNANRVDLLVALKELVANMEGRVVQGSEAVQ